MFKIFPLFFLGVLFSAGADSSVLVMKNGDRITGIVKKIWGNDVFIEPTYADEFSVDQSDVDYIIDDRDMTINLRDGRELVGTMAVNQNGEQIMIVNGDEVLVPLTALTELEEPEKFSDWEARFDINTSVNKGNTDSQNIKLSASTMYKYDRQRHILDLLTTTEEQNGIQTKDRDFAQYNFNLEVKDPWFFGASASYERDPLKNQKYRYNLVPAMGYDIFNDAYRLFSMQLGAGYQAEESIDQSDPDSVDDSGVVAAFIFRFSWDFGSPDLEFYANSNTTQSFYGRKNISTQWITGARYEITDLLYLNMEFDYSRESKPLEGAEPEDIALLFGFGMEFDK